MTSSSPRRVLIVRLSSLGDVLHTLPLACAVRDHWPDVHIGWVVEAPFADVLRGHRAVDRVFILPRGWLKSPGEIWKLRTGLREESYDVAIDPQGLFKSAMATRLSGAPRRLGFARPVAREGASLAYTGSVPPGSTHVVDMNLELLKPLGLEPGPARWDLPEWPENQHRMDAWLKVHNLESGRFVLLNPGAGWASKRWPTRRFADVARYLHDGFHLPSVAVWHGPEERGLGEEIVVYAHSGTSITVGPKGPMVWGDPMVRLAPPTTVPDLACLARRARLFVSGDTGPLHLAAAVGTPCVGLFGASSGARNGPYGAAHRTLQREERTGSAKARRRAGPEAMLALQTLDVERACLEVLGPGGAPARPGLHAGRRRGLPGDEA